MTKCDIEFASWHGTGRSADLVRNYSSAFRFRKQDDGFCWDVQEVLAINWLCPNVTHKAKLQSCFKTVEYATFPLWGAVTVRIDTYKTLGEIEDGEIVETREVDRIVGLELMDNTYTRSREFMPVDLALNFIEYVTLDGEKAAREPIEVTMARIAKRRKREEDALKKNALLVMQRIARKSADEEDAELFGIPT